MQTREREKTELTKKPAMQTFHEDEIIVKEGQRCDAMYKILSGSVAVYNRYGKRDEHLIGIYSAPGCFGELNVLSEQPGVYTAVAYNEVLVMRITRETLEEFIVNYPQNAMDIMQNMSSTIRIMQKNIDFLLDDLYEKNEINRKRTEELRQRMMLEQVRRVDWMG